MTGNHCPITGQFSGANYMSLWTLTVAMWRREWDFGAAAFARLAGRSALLRLNTADLVRTEQDATGRETTSRITVYSRAAGLSVSHIPASVGLRMSAISLVVLLLAIAGAGCSSPTAPSATPTTTLYRLTVSVNVPSMIDVEEPNAQPRGNLNVTRVTVDVHAGATVHIVVRRMDSGAEQTADVTVTADRVVAFTFN